MAAPFVNLNTGEIYNCEPGSWQWWHEKGHIEFDNTKGEIKLWQQYTFLFWMFSMTLSIVNKWMLIISLPAVLLYIGIEFYEERWANKYALEHS